jgi:hypothetical protein
MFSFIFIILGTLVALIPAVITGFLLPDQHNSRITFGIFDNDREETKRLMRGKRRRTLRAIGALIVSILVSIAGAYAYDKLMGRF